LYKSLGDMNQRYLFDIGISGLLYISRKITKTVFVIVIVINN
jgi:hypothetical protein